jgi:hypothetical protein
MALYYLKASGEFDAAIRDQENRPAGQKTWQNIKTFISAEYAKENKQNKLTAKNFKANIKPKRWKNSSQHSPKNTHIRCKHLSKAPQMQ